MAGHWFLFVLGICATWRVAHMVAHEDGPWDLVARLRMAAGDGQWGRLLDCFYCISLWVAAPIALAVGSDPIERLLAWPALSGAACLMDRLVPAPAAIIQPTIKEGDEDGMLRPATRDIALD